MPDYGEAPISSGTMHHAMSRGDHLEALFRDGKGQELSLAAPVWRGVRKVAADATKFQVIYLITLMGSERER